MSRKFEATPATRKAQNLFIGLVGPSSSGKTFTALELATGIQSVCGGEIAVIDTENNRALAYADHFKFLHIPFEPPWGSLDYVAALEYAATKAKTIVIDSASHEHEGEGGMIDYQEQEVERMAGSDYAKRERVKMLAWAKPKGARRQLLKAITRLDANVIMCFRAKNTSKPAKDHNGKSVVEPMGFVPIAGEEFVFEMSLSALFHPGSKGVPTWNPDLPGEKIAVKIPRQFEWLREQKGPLSRETGKALAEWARGPATPKQPERTPEPQHVEQPASSFMIVDQEGNPHDMENAGNWKDKIGKAIGKFTTSSQIVSFISRNTGAIADAALTHSDVADEVRVMLMDRKAELSK